MNICFQNVQVNTCFHSVSVNTCFESIQMNNTRMCSDECVVAKWSVEKWTLLIHASNKL